MEINSSPTSKKQLQWGGIGCAAGVTLALVIDRIAYGHFNWLRAAATGVAGGALGALLAPSPAPGRQGPPVRQPPGPQDQRTNQDAPTNSSESEDEGDGIQQGENGSEGGGTDWSIDRDRPAPLEPHSLHNRYYVRYTQIRQPGQLPARLAGAVVAAHLHHSSRGLDRIPANSEAVLLDLTGEITLETALAKTQKPLIVVGADEVTLPLELLRRDDLYFPEVKRIYLQAAEIVTDENVAPRLAKIFPSLQELTFAEGVLGSGVQVDLAERCPHLTSFGREHQTRLYLNRFDTTLLANRPQLRTIVMEDAGWDAVPDVLDLSSLPPAVCQEVLYHMRDRTLRELTLSTVSATDLRDWQAMGFFDTVQKIDLKECSGLTTDVFTPLVALPTLSLVELPDELPKGEWDLPNLDDPVLIRELYAKHPQCWEGSSVTCSLFWSAIPNSQGTNWATVNVRPSLAAQEYARSQLPSGPLDLINGDFQHCTDPTHKECSVWLMQAEPMSKERFCTLWPVVNQEAFADGSHYALAALRLTLRLWAETYFPEWVLDRDLCPEPPPRFNPFDPKYCDFQANIEGQPTKYLHKQSMGMISSQWAAAMLRSARPPQGSHEAPGFLGVGTGTFKAENAQEQTGFRAAITDAKAYAWAFDVAYASYTRFMIPDEELDGVLSVAHKHGFSQLLVTGLEDRIADRLLSEQPELTIEIVASLAPNDCRRLARWYAPVVTRDPRYQNSLAALLNRLAFDDLDFTARVLINVARHNGPAQAMVNKLIETGVVNLKEKLQEIADSNT